jgi:hypothetical protein
VLRVTEVPSKSTGNGHSGRRLLAAKVDAGLAGPSAIAEAPQLADDNARLASENARLLLEVAALQRELEACRGAE